MRKKLSTFLIILGIVIILIPIAGNIYLKYKHESMINEWIDSVDLNEQAGKSIVDEYNLAQEALLEIADMESGEITPSGADAVIPSPSDTGGLTPAAASSPSPVPTATPKPTPTKKPGLSKSYIEENMIGVIYIEKIDVKLPILNGTDQSTLLVAAGRMTQTGLPDEIGNMVIAGHRSSLGKYFNRLDELEPGDEIVIQTKTKELKYKVFKKLIVEPDDFSILNKNDTDKILTLFTCHPEGIGSQRLVVHAVQVN